MSTTIIPVRVPGPDGCASDGRQRRDLADPAGERGAADVAVSDVGIDRTHIQRLGGRAGVVAPQSRTTFETGAITTGAETLDEKPGRPLAPAVR